MIQAKLSGINRPHPNVSFDKDLNRQNSSFINKTHDIIGGGVRPQSSSSLLLKQHSSHKSYKVDGENSFFDSNILSSA